MCDVQIMLWLFFTEMNIWMSLRKPQKLRALYKGIHLSYVVYIHISYTIDAFIFAVYMT